MVILTELVTGEQQTCQSGRQLERPSAAVPGSNERRCWHADPARLRRQDHRTGS